MSSDIYTSLQQIRKKLETVENRLDRVEKQICDRLDDGRLEEVVALARDAEVIAKKAGATAQAVARRVEDMKETKVNAWRPALAG